MNPLDPRWKFGSILNLVILDRSGLISPAVQAMIDAQRPYAQKYEDCEYPAESDVPEGRLWAQDRKRIEQTYGRSAPGRVPRPRLSRSA